MEWLPVKSNKHVTQIRRILKATYPEVKTQLRHRNPFELLIATILSAQCTDRQVNMVTGALFEKYKTPDDFVTAPLKTLEKMVRPTGYFHNKAKHIKNCSRMLKENFNSRVPKTLEELITLPGVGRKTANVVLGAAFDIPGMVVDTHVSRISQRLELTFNKDPVKIEFDLMKIIPKKEWNDFSLHLIYFGREYCMARKPACLNCPIRKFCPYPHKNLPEV